MANANDLLIEVGTPGTATTLSAPGYAIGNTSLTVGSTTNWPTATGVIFAMDEVDSAGVRVDGTYNVYEGVVSGATSITDVAHITGSGTNRNYSAGATTRVYIVVASEITRRLVEWGLHDHGQLGQHETLTDDNGNEWLERGQTASAVNQVKISNAATGNAPVIESSGGDTNINLTIKPKGSTGIVQILDHNSNEVVKAGVGTASAVNEVTITNAATGNGPTISATGGDTNIDLALTGKGTGTVDLPTNFKGKVHYRQGGSSTIWGTGGTSNYDTSDEKVMVQCGTVVGSSSVDVTVTFPTAFTYAPVLLATIVTAGGFNTFVVTNSVTTSSFVFRCLDTTNTRRAETISWMAIGV